ncbi:MAG: response regulator [Bdellovibrionales bacterium]|nr:response regulator [Bdellovibrionales bacterium]
MSDKAVPARICVIDDDFMHNSTLCQFLLYHGYEPLPFDSASAFLAQFKSLGACDLVISDINMPGISGLDLCKAIRAMQLEPRLPIILLTGSGPGVSRALGIDTGADEYIEKPFPPDQLLAKVRSLLKIRTDDAKKAGELTQARRFISPNVANMLSAQDNQALLTPHRSEVTVLFVDLRRFTTFSSRVEPEEVLEVLGRYYTIVGNAAIKHQGTLGFLAGDGIMVFFNDPEPVPNHKQAALRMAIEAREALINERRRWNERNYDLDFGIGIAEGFATIGGVGFEQFSQYTVIGPVTNLASRLCYASTQGQILISQRFHSRLEADFCKTESIGELTLKGIDGPITVYNVLALN